MKFGRVIALWGIGIPLISGLLVLAAILFTPLPKPHNPEVTEVLDAHGKVVSRLFIQNRIAIPVVEMPKHLLDAIVAVEDDRFYDHRGVDLTGIGRALIRNLKARQVLEGGSTLTQQLARNLYLSHDRTLLRKFKELILTGKLEIRYSKQEILGLYLNTIYFGRGIYGIEMASQTYFGKPTRALTVSEAALLSGLPRAPEFYSPLNNPEAAVGRRNLVLAKMASQGYLTPQQAEAAKKEPLRLAAPKPAAGEAAYFLDLALRELRDRFPGVAENLYSGGYRIHTSIDMEMQKSAEQAVRAAAPAGDDSVQVALVAVEAATGYVRAVVGGVDPQVKRNRILEPKQPGSAFKPFVYAAALETKRYTIVSTQLDSPVQFPGTQAGAVWRPQNYRGEYSYSPTTMREALKRSLNVVTARWAEVLTPEPIVDAARRLGIQSTIDRNLTISLGSAAVTPLELATAYAPFANEGFRVTPIAIQRITDRQGRLIAEQRPTRERVIDPGVAFLITDMLRDVLAPGGTAAHGAGHLAGRPAAGKTGTTDDSVDAWFVGYTPDLVASVWVGTDENRPSTRTGAANAVPIWANFISHALHGRPHRTWKPPAGVLRLEICRISGLRPNASCPTAAEWYLAGTEPTNEDSVVHWDQMVPDLPGVPWAPARTLPATPPKDFDSPPRAEPANPWPPVRIPVPLPAPVPWF